MISVNNLSKSYGTKLAVDSLSFHLRPGAVTGFLGPNGSGKSTTMRCIVGLDAPTSGSATVDGLPYNKLKSPLTKVGALLDGKAFHPGRTARQHLRIVAATHGIPRRRVDEVLAFAGITDVADQKIKGFSLGMGQRLGIATAMLGDPEVLIFDEPVNGLDPDGVRWIRSMMRGLAAEGRTVLVSSHLMSEMSQTADDLIIIGRGRFIDAGPMSKFTENASRTRVIVEGPDMPGIESALRQANIPVEPRSASAKKPNGWLEVLGGSRVEIGKILHQAGAEIHELSETHTSLEDVFIELTSDSVEYSGMHGGPGSPQQMFPHSPQNQYPSQGFPIPPQAENPSQNQQNYFGGPAR